MEEGTANRCRLTDCHMIWGSNKVWRVLIG